MPIESIESGMPNKIDKSIGFKIFSLIFVCFFIIKILHKLVVNMHKQKPKISAYAPSTLENKTTLKTSKSPPTILLTKDFTSKFNEFKMLELMLDRPIGSIMIDAHFKNSPLKELLKSISQIGTPRPM